MDKKFLEKAKKQGKMRELSYVLKEYPVLEENHMGDINYYINEKEEVYGKFKIGDIVFVEIFEYIDKSFGQNHLFVIVDENNTAVPIDCFGFLISSKLEKLKFNSNILLKKDMQNSLKEDSIVKTDVLYILPYKIIIFKIGEVTMDNIMLYKKLYLEQINE